MTIDKRLTQMIAARKESEAYKYFEFGESYFKSRNDNIIARKKQIYLEGSGVQDNPFGANHKLPSGHFKKIVVQKVMYLLGNGVIFGKKDQGDQLNPYFSTSFDEFIIDAGKEASKKGEAWAYAFMDKNKLKFTLIPPEQLTPEYDEYDNLVRVLRRYDDGEKQVLLEIDNQEIKRYEKKKGKSGEFDIVSTSGHYTESAKFSGDEVGEPIEHGFGFVPFFPLYNNSEHDSDLYAIKALIDCYDIINSDFANNIDDMQEAYLTLKGYTGDTNNLSEFMRQLKLYKAVPVAETGDIESHQSIIPVEARATFLKLLRQDIYDFAMAVDLKSISGGSITNVMIKAMFADLDLKCKEFENEIRRFIFSLLKFINATDNKQFTDEMTFERSMIVNNKESVETLILLPGILSKKTIREFLPYDIDEDEEVKRLQEEEDEVQFKNVGQPENKAIQSDEPTGGDGADQEDAAGEKVNGNE